MLAPFLHDGLTAKLIIGLGYWEEGSLASFIPWSALGASSGAPGIPQGSHGRLLSLEKRELLQSCGVGLGDGDSQAEGVSKCSIPHPLVLGFEVNADIKVCPELCWSWRDLIKRITREFKPAAFFPSFGVCQALCEMFREVPQENKMLGLDVLEWSLHGCGKTCRVHTAACLWRGSSTSSAGREPWLPTAATLGDAGQNAEPQLPLWMV